MHKHQLSIPAYESNAGTALHAYRVGALLHAVLERLMRWQQRAADRSRLAELEPHRLDDIGLTPTQRDGEARKAFWLA